MPKNPEQTSNGQTKAHFWGTHIQSVKTSSLTAKQYCIQHALSYPTFLYWQSKQRKKSKLRRAIPLIPVKINEKRTTHHALCTLTLPRGAHLLIHDAVILNQLIDRLL